MCNDYVTAGYCDGCPEAGRQSVSGCRNGGRTCWLQHCLRSRKQYKKLTTAREQRRYLVELHKVAMTRLNTDTETERIRSECDNNASSVGGSQTKKVESSLHSEASTAELLSVSRKGTVEGVERAGGTAAHLRSLEDLLHNIHSPSTISYMRLSL